MRKKGYKTNKSKREKGIRMETKHKEPNKQKKKQRKEIRIMWKERLIIREEKEEIRKKK